MKNYGSLDSIETTKAVSGKDSHSVDVALMSEIDKTMKKYTDNFLHALEGLDARLSKLDGRTHQLENSMDDLKIVVGNSCGCSHGKIRQLENLLREVQIDVHLLKVEQEIMEVQFLLAKMKLQVSNTEQQLKNHNTANMDNLQPDTTSASESGSQQYLMPQWQQLQQGPSWQLPWQPQFQVPAHPQYSHPSLLPLKFHPSQPPQGHHHRETQFMQSQSYPMSSHQPLTHSPTRVPLSQHLSGAPPNMYEPQGNRLDRGVLGGYGSLSAPGDLYAYNNSPLQFGSGSLVKAPQLSSPPMIQAVGNLEWGFLTH